MVCHVFVDLMTTNQVILSTRCRQITGTHCRFGPWNLPLFLLRKRSFGLNGGRSFFGSLQSLAKCPGLPQLKQLLLRIICVIWFNFDYADWSLQYGSDV